jgi:hypothetical protein
MHEQTDAGVVDEIECLLGGRVGGHDDGWLNGVRRRRKIRVVHERYVRPEGVTSSKVELESIRTIAVAEDQEIDSKGDIAYFDSWGRWE